MIIIIALKIIRALVWKRRGDEWSCNRYEYVLYQIYYKRLERLADRSTKRLIKFYEFLSHGGYPNSPGNIMTEYMDKVDAYCNGSVW